MRPPPVSTTTKVAWGASFVLVVALILWLIWPVFAMLVASAALAYMLDPVIDRFEEKGWKREQGIAVIYVLLPVFATLALLIVVPAVFNQFAELSKNVNAYVSRLEGLIEPTAAWVEANTGVHVPLDWLELKATLPDLVKRISPDAGTLQEVLAFIVPSGTSLLSSVLGFFLAILNLALLPVFTFFLLNDWDRIIAGIDDLVPLAYRERVTRIAREVDGRLTGFVQGQLTVAAMLAVLYSIGLWLAGIDLPFVVGITSGILAIVPYLGIIVGILLSVALCVLKFGIDIHLVYVGLAFAIPQALEGWVITPKIMGDKVGLHAMVVMVALIVGGNLLGIWGMLLAIPITATFSVLGSEWLATYRESKVFAHE